MEALICPDCGAEHLEGTEALGHRVPCADCRLASEIAAEAAIPVVHPLAA